MNVDTLNSEYKVVSKYFASKTVMDESLSDFKEKKSFKVKNNKAPAKPKAKKVKRVKGQKDIRTVLKDKKNELVAYSEDFDSICKKSGIDVDSEQLQLAIALSKSLQTTDSAESSSSSPKSLTTQQRTGLIRTTLKEYGFKVPEKPTASRKSKKRRKPYKLLLTSEEEKQQIISDRYSQLLFELNNLKTVNNDNNIVLPNLFIYNMSTNVEYEKIKDNAVFYVDNIVEETPNNMGCLLKNWSDIPGRLSSPDLNKSELLFSEVECSQEELDTVLSGPLKLSKDILKKKNMLKDRGKSTYLSPIKRNINKTLIERSPNFNESISDNRQSPVFLTGSSNDINVSDKCNEYSTNLDNREDKNLLVVTQPSRSLSPDLFDDEEDAEVVIPNETTSAIENIIVNNVTKQTSQIMDLTECFNVISQKKIINNSNMKTHSQILQLIDVTKRNSNDFMEMTECVGSSSQHTLEKINEELDLTGQVLECAGEECAEPMVKVVDEHIDLTEECKDYLETTQNRSSRAIGIFSEGGNVDLTGNYVVDIEKVKKYKNADAVEHMDLTQSSSSSSDSLPFVHIGGSQAVAEKSLDDTIILNENDYIEAIPSEVNKELNDSYDGQLNQNTNSTLSQGKAFELISPKHVSVETDEVPIINLDLTCEVNEDNLNLTQTSDSNGGNNDCSSNSYYTNSSIRKKGDVSKHPNKDLNLNKNLDKVNDIMSPKQLSMESADAPIINLDLTCEEPEFNDDNVDLTQTSDSNEGNNIYFNKNPHINNSSLGKKDDVSVDYDEALENMNSFPHYDGENYENDTIVSENQPTNSKNNEISSNSKQEIMEISQIQLNSSSNNVDNHFDFGGISLIDNLSSFNSKSRNTNSLPSGSMRDSLPMVNVKGTCPEKPKSPLTHVIDHVSDGSNKLNEKQNARMETPKQNVNRHVNVETPEQSEYIVKTDNVTPMLDYTSMSTPERNKELDKYGLKPFKRKRAIQLLTHLYNQTHPYVESTEELLSPSKKRRTENLSQPSPSKPSSSTSISISPHKATKSPRKATKSPKKTLKSPRKTSRSPRNVGDGNFNDSDKDDNLFMVTREVPVIRSVVCDADDWVFQKREKAKLHTCRVPLHIAFHNYISCRQRLHEAILRYEPINIDVIHKELAASGHRYDPKDLLKYLDKRCITVKTADNTKNNKRY